MNNNKILMYKRNKQQKNKVNYKFKNRNSKRHKKLQNN